MKLTTIPSGKFKLDGGAMFGVVPKPLWNRLNPADENNKCTWSMRLLLIQHEGRNILVDTGIGNKQDDKFMSFFEPHGEDNIDRSLKNAGLTKEDITDVFITHLHFDHVGGAVSYSKDGKLVPTFPNAEYWCNKKHFDWAFYPNPREEASFLKENFVPLREAGKLRMIDVDRDDVEWMPGIKVRFVYGHTEAMMVLFIENKGETLVYCADLLPSAGHIGMPYVMAYDVRPLSTMAEKERLYAEALEGNYYLFLEHDPEHEVITIKKNERGKFRMDRSLTLEELAIGK